jgi:ABC-type lipoprotein export system ATPase subunit
LPLLLDIALALPGALGVPLAWGAALGALALTALLLARARSRRAVLVPHRATGTGGDGPALDDPLVELRGVSRVYRDAAGCEVRALDDVDLLVHQGEILGVIGPSGQGKSTLLNIIGGLDAPTHGEVRYRGVRLPREEGEVLQRHRATEVAFVFQDLNLVTHLSAGENAALPLVTRSVPRREALARASENLERLGLGELTHRRPSQLSGGQQQRVAIARAFTSPAGLILADEPTGSLDPETAAEVMDAFATLARAQGRTIVLVTHNTELAERICTRILRCTSDGLRPVPIPGGVGPGGAASDARAPRRRTGGRAGGEGVR